MAENEKEARNFGDALSAATHSENTHRIHVQKYA